MNVPALRQSLTETAACPRSYAFQVIEGRKMPGGMQSARGTEIHHVMSLYIRHCANRKVPADWAKFDELAYGAGEEAAGILNGLRDSYVVDFEHVFDTELTLTLTDGTTDENVVAEGTLDGLYFLTPTKARIDDFKSHPRPFDADKHFQAKLYSLMVFINFPEVQEVIFELIFVRYANCRRSVTYTRDDIPTLTQAAVNARRRQVQIHTRHAAGEELQALPGNHCQYCPLLQGLSCPIAEFNPAATLSLPDRLRFAIWAEQIGKVNKQVLRDAYDASGRPIECADGNGRLYQFGMTPTESMQFPLPMVLEALDDWEHASGEDLKPKLLVSSTKLKQYAGAKKRVVLDQFLKDHATLVSKPKFKITTPAETDEAEPVMCEWEE